MYTAFDVLNKKPLNVHMEGVVQMIGRLCGVVMGDVNDAPTIRLWAPKDCHDVISR